MWWDSLERVARGASPDATRRIIMKTRSIAMVVGGLLFAGVALAAKPSGFKARPWVFDPDGLGISEARWVANEGNPGHALYLTKMGLTTDFAASGASIDGVDGITLEELGFDVRNDGHCGAGAPRFNVYTADDVYFFFGCTYGTHEPAPGDSDDWTRVRFGDADAVPAGATPWPGFGTAVVTAIDIVFDEGTDQGEGFTYLDNIDVNGTLIGKPGNAK
jgi:hypothetical protein